MGLRGAVAVDLGLVGVDVVVVDDDRRQAHAAIRVVTEHQADQRVTLGGATGRAGRRPRAVATGEASRRVVAEQLVVQHAARLLQALGDRRAARELGRATPGPIAQALRDVEVDHADRGIDVVGQRPAPGGELEREALSHGARVRVLRRAGPWVAIGGRGGHSERDSERDGGEGAWWRHG